MVKEDIPSVENYIVEKTEEMFIGVLTNHYELATEDKWTYVRNMMMMMIHSHPHNQRLGLKLSSMSMSKLPEYNVLSKKCKIQSYIHKFSFKANMDGLEGITSEKKEVQTKEAVGVLRKEVL